MPRCLLLLIGIQGFLPRSAYAIPVWTNGQAPGVPIGNQCVTGDFNGDGKSDVACYWGSGGNWGVSLSTGAGWKTETWANGQGPTVPTGNQCVTGDFNGDGKSDVACYWGSGSSWGVSLSTGAGWRTETWANGQGPAGPVANRCVTGDFNGDGRTDISCYWGGGTNWGVSLSTGAGWRSETWADGQGPAVPVGNQCVTGDFNADGKTDISCYWGGGANWGVSLSTGTGWRSETWPNGQGPAVPVGNQCVTGDFNADGKTDISCYWGSGANWGVSLSTGSGWRSLTWGNGQGPAVPIGDQCVTGDFNGDGKTDISCYWGGGTNWGVSLSTGAGWQSLTWANGQGPAVPIGKQCVTGFFNADGNVDLACYTGSGGNWAMSLSTGMGWAQQ